jgi:hypothetical protein
MISGYLADIREASPSAIPSFSITVSVLQVTPGGRAGFPDRASEQDQEVGGVDRRVREIVDRRVAIGNVPAGASQNGPEQAEIHCSLPYKRNQLPESSCHSYWNRTAMWLSVKERHHRPLRETDERCVASASTGIAHAEARCHAGSTAGVAGEFGTTIHRESRSNHSRKFVGCDVGVAREMRRCG